jgi:hypothetical protein
VGQVADVALDVLKLGGKGLMAGAMLPARGIGKVLKCARLFRESSARVLYNPFQKNPSVLKYNSVLKRAQCVLKRA